MVAPHLPNPPSPSALTPGPQDAAERQRQRAIEQQQRQFLNMLDEQQQEQNAFERSYAPLVAQANKDKPLREPESESNQGVDAKDGREGRKGGVAGRGGPSG